MEIAEFVFYTTGSVFFFFGFVAIVLYAMLGPSGPGRR